MQHFHSNKSFNQYKPHQTFWQKLKAKRKKKAAVINVIQENSLKNPFKKEIVPSKNKAKIVWIIFIILIGSWIALMLTLPYFKICKINISGNKITKASEVENYVRNFNLQQSNYFLFADKSVSEKIKQLFLYENVQIKKVFPDTIQINVEEKPASIIYDDNSNYYLLDADGKVIKTLAEFINIPEITVTSTSSSIKNTHLTTYQQIKANYGSFPVIFNDKPVSSADKIILSPKIIKSAVDWENNLKELNFGNIVYFKIGDTDFNLKIFLTQPWHLIINTDSDIQSQLHNLKIITTNNKPTEYIDLRFGERVYWK